jgi:hypothetical protein
MGRTYADVELINSDDIGAAAAGYIAESQIRRLTMPILVDTGASMMSIPPSVRSHLGLRKTGEGDAELADGSIVQFDVVGPIEIRYQTRHAVVEALVAPIETDALLGAIPRSAMDVLVHPLHQTLMVNPKSPMKAKYVMKGMRSTP